MPMITSTARRPYASTLSEPVECSNFEVHVNTRSLALEHSIHPFRMPCTGRPGAEDKMALDGTSERRGCPSGQGSLSLGVADEGSSGSVSHLDLLWWHFSTKWYPLVFRVAR